MKIKHWLKDVVIVRMIDEVKTHGGLLLPEIHDNINATKRAVVLTVSKNCRWKDEIKKGDTIIVKPYVGTDREINGKKVRVYDGEDVIAKIED